jgi:hypothetical protein
LYLLLTLLPQLISDVPPGIGTIKNVSLAQIDGPSTLTISVFQFPINALLPIVLDTALPALKDMISRMDNVSSHFQTTLNPLISDVEHGIGIIKFA